MKETLNNFINKKRFTEMFFIKKKENLKRFQLFTRGGKMLSIGGQPRCRGIFFLWLGWAPSHKILKFEEKGLVS